MRENIDDAGKITQELAICLDRHLLIRDH